MRWTPRRWWRPKAWLNLWRFNYYLWKYEITLLETRPPNAPRGPATKYGKRDR